MTLGSRAVTRRRRRSPWRPRRPRSPAAPAPAATAPLPSVVVSPLTGTPDANPATQISFLGVPAADCATSSSTARAAARTRAGCAYYSTHTGGSFLPSRRSMAGEHVTVSATVVGYGAPGRIGTSFTCPRPTCCRRRSRAADRGDGDQRDALPLASRSRAAGGHGHHAGHRPGARRHLHLAGLRARPGRPDDRRASGPARLVRPAAERARPRSTSTSRPTTGAPVLTWWQGEVVGGHGQGVDVIESDRYRPIATVTPATASTPTCTTSRSRRRAPPGSPRSRRSTWT